MKRFFVIVMNRTYSRIFEKISIIYTFEDYIIKFNKYAYLVTKYYLDTDDILSLKIGQIIRIGKHMLKILSMKIKNDINYKRKTILPISSEDQECRVCFNQGENITEDLISVCDCKGSLKYIHISCLRRWIRSKCDINYKYISPNLFTISITNFYCEICKKNFPLIVMKGNECYYLIDALKNKDNYIVFKNKIIENEYSSKNIQEDKIESKTIELYLLEFSKYKFNFTIGRDQANDLTLSDVSVSKFHCSIYMEGASVKIKDNLSKFGTLISMTDDITINEFNRKATVQKGNTVYHFNLKN